LENAAADELRFRETFRGRRDHLLRRLAAVEGLHTTRPEGAFYVFPRYDREIPSLEFCSQLLAEEKLAVVPGVAFGPHGEGHVRISYSSPVEALDDGVDRLERFLARRSPPARGAHAAAARPF
jgi:aspartate/methionine/tyrosine aminotransferase